jgi:probable RNA-binding protein EIF1AD
MAGLGRRSHYRKHITDTVLNTCPEPGEAERIAKVVGTRGSNQFEIILSSSRKSTCRKTISTTSACGSNAQARHEQNPQQKKQQQQQNQQHQEVFGAIGSSSARIPKLAILPTKYRKLVWVKRNDFVIVRCGEDEGEYEDAPSKDEGNTIDHKTPLDAEAKVEEAAAGGTSAAIRGIRYEISHILYKDQIKHLKRKQLWPEDDPCFAEGVADGRDAGAAANDTPAVQGDDEEYEEDYENYDGEGGDDDGIVYDGDDLLFVNTNKISTLRVEDSESESESDSS